eukprot:m.298325 g.298325  ORF g.298325 m.298325 type:complete len:453 (-) comp13833_c0_seq1:1843-3201(-)
MSNSYEVESVADDGEIPAEPEQQSRSTLALVRGWIADVARNGVLACLSHNLFFLGVVGTVFLYFLVGGIFYSQVEGWSALESFYFIVVMTTTVGYGDYSPTTDGSKVFTFFYAMFGITLFAAVLSVRIRFVTKISSEEAADELLDPMLNYMGDDDHPPPLHIPDKDIMDRTRSHNLKGVIARLFGAFLLLLALGIAFACGELEYSFVDGMYWSLITATGIGFGDLSPSKDANSNHSTGGMWFGIFFIILSFVWLFYVLDEINGYLHQRELKRQVEGTLTKNLSRALFLTADANGDGRVSKFEWLSMALSVNGIVRQPLLNRIMQRFDELDVDDSGFLSREDIIIAFSTSYSQRADALEKRAERRRLSDVTRAQSAVLQSRARFKGLLKKKGTCEPTEEEQPTGLHQVNAYLGVTDPCATDEAVDDSASASARADAELMGEGPVMLEKHETTF